tara:strand:- start:2789 stop:3757 length:969 start_codon:yes stop_codon:yes gene_type:complete
MASLIISIDQDDSTTDVCKWLFFLDSKFIRLSESSIVKNVNWGFPKNKITIEVDQFTLDLNSLKSVWYRRGNWTSNHQEKQLNPTALVDESFKFLEYEERAFKYALHDFLKSKNNLSNYNLSKVNKIEVLNLASSIGLKIPESRIINSKKALINFMTDKRVITKPLENPLEYYADTYWIPTYTEEITDEMLPEVPNKFGVSLFQELIEKKYELRVVYLEGDFFSMAIFSQLDNQTEVDFRRYNHESPNRNVPYKLPIVLELKITQLMNELELNFGSIDILVNCLDEYIFLEVNPIGQFGMTSFPCNYNLEKKIAKKIIRNNV